MKKYIRDILDDLSKPAKPTTTSLDIPPAPVAPDDLANQDLSSDPQERVRQLDYQAQRDEERETLE